MSRHLSIAVVVHRIMVVCRGWHDSVTPDEVWKRRFGLSELPSGFSSWFEYAQRQTMRQQALYHLYGRDGLAQNWRRGLQLLSVLANAGDDYAMALYGWCLHETVGIHVNLPSAEQLLQQSNHAIARVYCSLRGIGMARNLQEAARLLATECDASDPHVQFLQGLSIDYGLHSRRNRAQAFQCYQRAAGGNHIVALTHFAYLLADANATDRPRCLAFYRLTATQGHAVAQNRLGHWHEIGIPGVLGQDIAQAKYWYAMSAAQGDAQGIEAMARL
eukprot:TRINITY_DN7217_c0_g1_i6.p1 TRINITY_DN7217_c0_g1~~TRINITY_DN7217_c0_g1_i6.p1  ORF type:complete len:274 (+),score=43.70 TRINITY_DN7217_c0_g1_i6:267-1088(+)